MMSRNADRYEFEGLWRMLDAETRTFWVSVLADADQVVRLRRALANQAAFVEHPRYPLIFDPQTAGGLLASVPAEAAAQCVAELRAAGYAHTAIIGRVLPQGDSLEPVTLMA